MHGRTRDDGRYSVRLVGLGFTFKGTDRIVSVLQSTDSH